MVHLPDPQHDESPRAADEALSVGPISAEAPSEADVRRAEPRREAASEAKDVPRPIGPERLRALREAIRSGSYPTDADVMGGLVRMFREPDAPEPDAPPPAS